MSARVFLHKAPGPGTLYPGAWDGFLDQNSVMWDPEMYSGPAPVKRRHSSHGSDSDAEPCISVVFRPKETCSRQHSDPYEVPINHKPRHRQYFDPTQPFCHHRRTASLDRRRYSEDFTRSVRVRAVSSGWFLPDILWFLKLLKGWYRLSLSKIYKDFTQRPISL